MDVREADLESPQQGREMAPARVAGQRMDAQVPVGSARASRIWSMMSLARPTSPVQSRRKARPTSLSRTTPRAAVEERRADVVFQLLHAAGHDRLRHPHLARGLGEALGLGDANEGLDVFQAVHGFAM